MDLKITYYDLQAQQNKINLPTLRLGFQAIAAEKGICRIAAVISLKRLRRSGDSTNIILFVVIPKL